METTKQQNSFQEYKNYKMNSQNLKKAKEVIAQYISCICGHVVGCNTKKQKTRKKRKATALPFVLQLLPIVEDLQVFRKTNNKGRKTKKKRAKTRATKKRTREKTKSNTLPFMPQLPPVEELEVALRELANLHALSHP